MSASEAPKPNSGRCPVCRALTPLKKDGTIAAHAPPEKDFCKGGGRPPLAEAPRVEKLKR